MPAVEPDAAAHAQVEVVGPAVVPQRGGAEQHQQIVESGLLAVVGVELGRAVGVEHPVKAAVRVVGEAGGVVVVKADPDVHGVRRGGIGQLAVFFLWQKRRNGQYGV